MDGRVYGMGRCCGSRRSSVCVCVCVPLQPPPLPPPPPPQIAPHPGCLSFRLDAAAAAAAAPRYHNRHHCAVTSTTAITATAFATAKVDSW